MKPIRLHRTVPILAALVLLALAQPARAQQADLSWKWTPGSTDRFRLIESMQQTVSADAPVELDWARTLEFTQTVTRTTNGVTISRTFDAVAVEVTRSDAPDPVRYDSKDPTTADARAHPLVAPFAQMLGQTLRVQLNAEGRVTRVQGQDNLLAAMLGPLEQQTPGLSGLLPKTPAAADQRLIAQTQAALDLIPNRRVRQGRSWPVDIPHALPLVGQLDSAITATLERTRRGTATVRLEGTFTQAPTETGLALLELKRSAISGQIEFDLERGQPNRQRLEIESAWSATADLLDALGVEPTEQTLHQTAELTRISP